MVSYFGNPLILTDTASSESLEVTLIGSKTVPPAVTVRLLPLIARLGGSRELSMSTGVAMKPTSVPPWK